MVGIIRIKIVMGVNPNHVHTFNIVAKLVSDTYMVNLYFEIQRNLFVSL